ncbi:MAG TPA: AAA family ATPase [Bacillota bacterium]|nr:AAA family ATPase [Bacillota bacterium]
MNEQTVHKVYIVSGPAGVGKSTTSKELVKTLKNSAYISGDYISHMHVNGRQKPWESQKEVSLIWDNILSLTKNFLRYGNDVVIDYVTFPHEAKWVHDNLKKFNVEVNYVVLWTDVETLVNRDNLRKPEHRMGERCLILVDEFKASGLDEKHLFDTSDNISISDAVNEVINNPAYQMN